MKERKRLVLNLTVLCAASILTATIAACPKQVWAQTAGQNDVWKNSTTPKGSSAFIDASVFGTNSTGICTYIYTALNSVGTQPGVVIDARGINTGNSKPDTNGNMACSDVTGGTPWYQGGAVLTNPA